MPKCSRVALTRVLLAVGALLLPNVALADQDNIAAIDGAGGVFCLLAVLLVPAAGIVFVAQQGQAGSIVTGCRAPAD